MSNIITGIFRFDPHDPVYETHFQGNPVTPGSVIVQAFMEVLAQRGKRVKRIKRFKFRSFVTPGNYEYCIEEKNGLFSCTLISGKRFLVTGSLE